MIHKGVVRPITIVRLSCIDNQFCDVNRSTMAVHAGGDTPASPRRSTALAPVEDGGACGGRWRLWRTQAPVEDGGACGGRWRLWRTQAPVEEGGVCGGRWRLWRTQAPVEDRGVCGGRRRRFSRSPAAHCCVPSRKSCTSGYSRAAARSAPSGCWEWARRALRMSGCAYCPPSCTSRGRGRARSEA